MLGGVGVGVGVGVVSKSGCMHMCVRVLFVWTQPLACKGGQAVSGALATRAGTKGSI